MTSSIISLTKRRLYHTILEGQENLYILLQNNMQDQNSLSTCHGINMNLYHQEITCYKYMNSFKQIKTVHCLLKYPLNALNTSKIYTIENQGTHFKRSRRINSIWLIYYWRFNWSTWHNSQLSRLYEMICQLQFYLNLFLEKLLLGTP